MKKGLLLLALMVLLTGSLFAGDIDLGDFPVGQWLDPTYDAIWDFSTGNIRILGLNGEVIWNFGSKGVEDFAVGVSGTGPQIKFSCAAADKTYTITKTLTDSDLVLEIDKPGKLTYKVTMKKQ